MKWSKAFFDCLSPESKLRLARELGRQGCKEDDASTFDLMPTDELRSEWNRGYYEDEP